MKFVSVSAIAILLASGVMSARDSRGLDLRIQVGAEMTRPYQSILFSADNSDFKAQPDNQTAPQIRMLGELPGAPGFYYSLGGRLESSSKMDYVVTHPVTGAKIDVRDVEVKYSYFSFGGSYLWNTTSGFSLGLHLEGRVERVSADGPIYTNDLPSGRLEGNASFLRPWGRLSMDYTFNNSGKVRPFLGIEGAFPITKREQKNSYWAINEPQEPRLLESIAPQGSFAVYFGFRL